MKIINKKLMISFSVVLLLAVAFFSTMTLMFADDENGAGGTTPAPTGSLPAGKTIIDYIIDNSHDTESADQVYHVLELKSDTSNSDLEKMLPSLGDSFEKLVFNGHKSEAQDKDYNPGKLDYTSIQINAADDSIIAAINNADIIYVSESPATLWGANNDVSEAVKDALVKFATSDFKPIIMDSHSLTQQIQNSTVKTVKGIGNQYYSKYGSNYSTYKWPHDMNAATFMNPADLSALYVPVNGATQSTNGTWATVTKEGESAKEYVGRVLTITNGTTTSLTNEFKKSFEGAFDFTDKTVEPDDYDTTGEFLKLKGGSAVYNYGYYGRGLRPTALNFSTIDIGTPTGKTAAASIDYSKYDFVILEGNTADVNLSSDTALYNSLVNAMYSGVHLLYDSLCTDNTNNDKTVSALEAKNLAYLYDKIATVTDTPRYGNVLVTARQKMSLYASATTPKGVQDISDIIDAGSFRGIMGTEGDSSNVYTVLEIEPNYPINMTLAKELYNIKGEVDPLNAANKTFSKMSDRDRLYAKPMYNSGDDKGFYYMRSSSVSDSTSDEISFGDGKSLTDLLDGSSNLSDYVKKENLANVTDYYNWTISRAKIAHATGRNINQLKVVHMSAVEFASSRKTLLDNYDAIYIGGDYSATKSADNWYTKSNQNGNYYTMYTHNYDSYPYASDRFTYNDKVGEYGVYGGNDLTVSKLEELKAYAKKMPVIFDKSVSDAYVGAVNNGSGQHLLDPESNMYQLIESLTELDGNTLTSAYPSTTLVNFDSKYTIKTANIDSMYGSTYGGYATVFGGVDSVDYIGRNVDNIYYVGNSTTPVDKTGAVCEAELAAVLQTARPLLAVTSAPTTYSESDKNTWLDPAPIQQSKNGLQWKVGVSVPATVNLYIDDDSNGRFTASEILDTKSGSNVTLSFKPGADYYGVIYWKVEAKLANGLSSSTTGVCKIKRTTQSKMYVNLLQIMPGRNLKKTSSGSNENDPRTLYLCTDCQFAGVVLHNTPYVDTGIFAQKFLGRYNTYNSQGKPQSSKITSTASVKEALGKFDSKFDTEYYIKGISDFGTHTHDFGIVKYYDDLTLSDGTTGWDNVLTNWFDVLRDDYDVDTTILYTDEYEQLINDVKNYYAGMSADKVKEQVEGAKGFEEMYNEYNNYYLTMKALINNPDDKFITVSGNDYSVDFNKLDSAYPTTIPFTEVMANVGISKDELTKYAAASYQMDKVLSAKRADIVRAGANDTQATKEEMERVVDSITNKDITRDMRKYYILFSNYNACDNRIPDDYVKYYNDWRDAKMFENFFFEMYQRNMIYASYDIGTENLRLSDVYSCIAIGAANTFANDDINEVGCDALLNYIDDNGNIILFHDSLNGIKGMTATMTNKLSTAFGMNARHQKVETIKTPVDNNVSISIDGIQMSENADLNKDIGSRTVTYKQKASDIVATDDSVKIKVGETTTNIAGLSNTDSGYDVLIEKKKVTASKMKLYIAPDVNELTNVGYALDLPGNASKATISFTYNWYGNYTPEPKLTITEYDNSGSTHNIEITNAGNRDIVVSVDGKNNSDVYRGDNNKVAVNGKFTISSDYSSSGSVSVDTYTIKSITKKAGTINGYGIQEFDVKVVDDTNKPVDNVKIDYTVNGVDNTIKSDSSGEAVFYRENYKVDGYEKVGEDTVTQANGNINDQMLYVVVQDFSGKEIQGKTVTATNDGKSSRKYTDATGKAAFVYSNYIETIPDNPTFITEDIIKYPKTTYFISKIKDNYSITPRMLTFKGYLQGADEGNLHLQKNISMFKYSLLHYKNVESGVGGPLLASKPMQSEIKAGSESYLTDKTQKNNEGIITVYPFAIGNRMQISSTAPGDYALDIEDDDLVVYYSMVGGTYGSASSLMAADPMDGLNNYFLYQYGSVTYTGAGYSLITGYQRSNNDERKLYINIIVNAGRKSAKGPSLSLYDLDTTMDKVESGKANKIIKEYNGGDDCDYITEIEDLTDFKGFDFLASIPASSNLKNVKIFYDVNHTDDGVDGTYNYDTATDKLIFDSAKKISKDSEGNVIEDETVDGNMLKSIKSGITDMKLRSDNTTPMIALKEDCFDAKSGNQYAYIVVQVEDSNGEKASATLRIQLKPALIELN